MHPQFYEDTYSTDDLSKLCSIGAFQLDNTEVFSQRLEDIAAIYRWEASRHTDMPRNGDVARELESLIKRSERLGDSIKNLFDKAFGKLHVQIANNHSRDAGIGTTLNSATGDGRRVRV